MGVGVGHEVEVKSFYAGTGSHPSIRFRPAQKSTPVSLYGMFGAEGKGEWSGVRLGGLTFVVMP